jgi:DNA-binding LytR/AlgR family response regulator
MNKESICYIEKVNGYTLVHYEDNTQKLLDQSLKLLQELLPEKNFFRANKSIIINIYQIIEICPGKCGTTALLKNGKLIFVSKRKKKELLDLIMGQ